MINNYAAYKYENPYKGPFVITKCWNNGTVTLTFIVIKNRYNMRHIKPQTSDTNIEDINLGNSD